VYLEQAYLNSQIFNKMKNKRGISGLIWILIILVLIAVGIGVYFLLTGDSSSVVSGGNSIPQPPALPS
jgi:flagellar basal body-associated protein FliL